jgi:hypothetical protein
LVGGLAQSCVDDAAPDLGEVDHLAADPGPGFPAVEDLFDVVDMDVGPADGNGVAVVRAGASTGAGCEEWTGAIEDARVAGRCPVACEAQLTGDAVTGIDEIQC